MRVYSFQSADGKIFGQPFAANDDDAAKRQVVTCLAPVVLDGVTEYDDFSVVCLFSFDPADPRASMISMYEEIAKVGEIFAAALLKFLDARPSFDFDKLQEEVHEDA